MSRTQKILDPFAVFIIVAWVGHVAGLLGGGAGVVGDDLKAWICNVLLLRLAACSAIAFTVWSWPSLFRKGFLEKIHLFVALATFAVVLIYSLRNAALGQRIWHMEQIIIAGGFAVTGALLLSSLFIHRRVPIAGGSGSR